jgi:hypothetical protein
MGRGSNGFRRPRTRGGGARARAAVHHVAALSAGEPLAPGSRITLNFHPDRLAGDLPVLEARARDGAYRSQFVTGTSNGGLTAHPGGDRRRRESRISHRGGAGPRHLLLSGRTAHPRARGRPACPG